jgi:hypothetical protein
MKIKVVPFLLIYGALNAQNSDPIQTDRPDQTETSAITPTGMLQVETGLSYQKNNELSSKITTPSTLWKYGVNENFELRLITEYNFLKENSQSITGLIPILVGCKIKISEEKGIFPKTSFISHISLPKIASSEFKADYFAPKFRFAMQHSISDKVSFSYNLGSEWDGFSAEPTFIYTVTTGYSITPKIGSYIELFGFAPQNDKANHNFDGGFTYLINDNFMLDLSSGVGLTNNAPDYYLAFGFSFRL